MSGEGDEMEEADGASQTSSCARKIDPARLAEVEEMLLGAVSPRRIVAALAPKYDVTRRQVYTYIAIVRRRIAKLCAERTPVADGEIAREMLLDAYETARLGNEHGPNASAMVQAARAYAELTGALQPQRVDITSGGKPIRSMTDDELLAEARRLAAAEADGDEPRPTH